VVINPPLFIRWIMICHLNLVVPIVIIMSQSKTRIWRNKSISLTEPHDQWLKSQIDTNEYTSKSELANDLIRQARIEQKQVGWIRLKLEKAEKSGFTNDSKEDIL